MNVRNLAIWGAIALLVIGMAIALGGNPEAAHASRAKLSDIYALVDAGEVIVSLGQRLLDGRIALDEPLADGEKIVVSTDAGFREGRAARARSGEAP